MSSYLKGIFFQARRLNKERATRHVPVCAVAWLTACLLMMAVLPSFAESSQQDIPYFKLGPDQTGVIRVGVRKEAEPFSFLKATRAENAILPGYGGYIVEICRNVLRQMVSSAVFHDYQIKPVIVEANDRFSKLAEREVDLLCGPDSITTERLRLYNVSYPVFLSGIARFKQPTDRMPRKIYCKPILGMVGGTTSEQAGIQAMLNEGMFGERFVTAIKGFLREKSEGEKNSYESSLSARMNKFVKSLNIKEVDKTADHNGDDEIASDHVRTEECPAGFDSGPVVSYKSHAVGLKDLCAGRLLYYLGDVDIVKRNLPPNCDHIEQGQRTFTKEAYGVYFRKPPRRSFAELDEEELRDAVLYSEFNYLLILEMQSAERLLENQYREEFGDAQMASDLRSFFDTMQYATDY